MINWHHQIRWNGPRNTKYTSNNISLYLVCCVVMCLCTQLLKAQRYFHLPFSPINCVAPVRTYICHTCSFMNFGDLIKFPVSPSVDQSRGANQDRMTGKYLCHHSCVIYPFPSCLQYNQTWIVTWIWFSSSLVRSRASFT